MAVRWDASQLIDFDGAQITQVAFVPKEAEATFLVRVWKGAEAETMLADQEVNNPVIGAWNYITLDNPIPVDASQDLWIGYHVNTSGGFPAGADAGPAIDEYANMINYNGWQTLLQIAPDLNFNWNIQGYVQKSGSAESLISSRMLTGFNIYMSIDGEPYEIIEFNPYGPSPLGPDLPNGMYCFKATAVFESETDYCESDYSNDPCVMMNVGIDENARESELNFTRTRPQAM